MNMKKKMTYVCPSLEIIPMEVEKLLNPSYVDEDGGDGPGGIGTTDGGDPNEPGGPPAPGKGWNFDDDDDLGGVNDWGSMWD